MPEAVRASDCVCGRLQGSELGDAGSASADSDPEGAAPAAAGLARLAVSRQQQAAQAVAQAVQQQNGSGAASPGDEPAVGPGAPVRQVGLADEFAALLVLLPGGGGHGTLCACTRARVCTKGPPSCSKDLVPRVLSAHVLRLVQKSAALSALSQCAQVVGASEKEAMVQCVVLKMLTDFSLMYGACVGVLLRRDTDAAAREAGKTPTKLDVHSSGLLRHVMHVHLAPPAPATTLLQSLAEQASFFLLAVCIRRVPGPRSP
jgi:hypothetical protein